MKTVPYEASRFTPNSYAGQGMCSQCGAARATRMNPKATRAYCDGCAPAEKPEALFPIVRDSLKLRRKAREGKTHGTRDRARAALEANVGVMTAQALNQYNDATRVTE